MCYVQVTLLKRQLESLKTIFIPQDMHKDLEEKIAKFHGREDAILYASCFDANAGLFEVLLGSDDAIFSDEMNHASIIDGIRLCKAKRHRYKHLDMEGNTVALSSTVLSGSLDRASTSSFMDSCLGRTTGI